MANSVKPKGTFKPPEFPKGVGGAAPEGTVEGSAETRAAEKLAGSFALDLEIGYAATEMAVHATDVETGDRYELPLPSPVGFGPFSDSLNQYKESFSAGGANKTETLIALARMVWILEHQGDDDFDPRDIPEQAVMDRFRALNWRSILIYQTLIVSAAERLGEVMGFSKGRPGAARPTKGNRRVRRSGSRK